MSKLHPNAVASVSNPGLLVILAPEGNSAICDQYAEEGYDVLHVLYPAPAAGTVTLPEGRAWACITFGLEAGGAAVIEALGLTAQLKAVVHYAAQDAAILKDTNGRTIPTTFHIAASQTALHETLLPLTDPINLTHESPPPIKVYTYPVPESPAFPLLATPPAHVKPGHKESVVPHLRSAISLSYTRTLELLKRVLGPYYDLEALWERHTFFEFAERSTAKTMATMVAEPYVNHIPTLTGGMGYKNLSRFYKYHFIPKSPPDTELICVSRTVGADRVIDEMIFKCTHTTEVDWLLPGVAPTGKVLEIPLVGVVAFRGDKLTFEHLYWDQASVLVQAGLLEKGNLPIAGAEAARKVLDPFGTPSNELMARWEESKGLPID